MAPVVITDKSGNFVYTGGASGGTKITTAVAGIITKTLMMDIDLNKQGFQSALFDAKNEKMSERFENLDQATQEARVHHQLMPMKLTYGIFFANYKFNSITLILRFSNESRHCSTTRSSWP